MRHRQYVEVRDVSDVNELKKLVITVLNFIKIVE